MRDVSSACYSVAYRDLKVTLQPSFWTEAVNKELKEAYQRSHQAYASCAGRANQPLPVIILDK